MYKSGNDLNFKYLVDYYELFIEGKNTQII